MLIFAVLCKCLESSLGKMKHRRGLLEFELDCFWWSICFLIEASVYKGQRHVQKFLSKWIFGNNTISLSIFAFHKTKQRYSIVATSLSDVALKLPYCWDGNVRRRCKSDVVCNVSLWRLFMRHCNDVVFATSSDVSITNIWRRKSDVG